MAFHYKRTKRAKFQREHTCQKHITCFIQNIKAHTQFGWRNFFWTTFKQQHNNDLIKYIIHEICIDLFVGPQIITVIIQMTIICNKSKRLEQTIPAWLFSFKTMVKYMYYNFSKKNLKKISSDIPKLLCAFKCLKINLWVLESAELPLLSLILLTAQAGSGTCTNRPRYPNTISLVVDMGRTGFSC